MPLIALLFTLLFAVEAPALLNKVPQIESARITRVATSQQNPSFMAVASRTRLYLSTDAGIHFTTATGLMDEQIRHLFMDESLPDSIYIAGDRHCYHVSQTTTRIFSAREDESIYSIAKYKNRIYIGTSNGLYAAQESLQNWMLVSGLKNRAVYAIETGATGIYLACEDGAYWLPEGGSPDRLFVTRTNGEEVSLKLHLLKPDRHNPNRLWLCTSKGLFCSSDIGQTWQKLYASGTGNLPVYCLQQPSGRKHQAFICTNAGLFDLDLINESSRPLFEGVSSSETRWMDLDADGNIYLATDQGLFTDKLQMTNDQPSSSPFDQLLASEPPIYEIQTAALRYNAVHPDKTNRWRKRLKYRALFPKVSVDYDKTIGSSFTKDQHYFAEGPNDWGVSITWDMGNLIWNSYEDDIDNRTKLTTQLRIDVLAEINRLYFERLRLKQEISAGDPLTEETLLKKLRLRELTATLDGYTGGYLSRHIRNQQNRP